MKNLSKVLILMLILLVFYGCKSFNILTSAKKSAQGSPYEVLVVCDNREWEGAVGENLRSLFSTQVKGINQSEPMFSTVRITASDFKGLLPDYRNILKVLCSPSVKECSILARYDVTASPQIELTFQGPSQKAMVEYLNQHGGELLQVLEIAERDRTINFATKHGERSVEEILRKKFDIEMAVPKGYIFRAQSDSFVWISHEYPMASQGFFIYSRPYNGKQDISTKALVKARNEFAKRIPGPSDGSYMTTVEKIPNLENDGYVPFEPERKAVRINGRSWIELRGLWEVENDFMGGPFVSYTTLDERTNRLITLDCYVYSPKYGKRNHLRALEHLVYVISFPEK